MLAPDLRLLRAAFVRVPGQRDRIYVHRSDGSETSWVFPSYGDGLPHDLVHLVIESAFGLRRGFWGRVDAGVDPARIAEEANRRGGAAKYRAFGEDHEELLVAEALAGGAWSHPGATDRALDEAIRDNCARLGVAVPEGLTPERLSRAQRVIGRLAARWRGYEGKGTLELGFTPEDPQRGFAVMEQS